MQFGYLSIATGQAKPLPKEPSMHSTRTERGQQTRLLAPIGVCSDLSIFQLLWVLFFVLFAVVRRSLYQCLKPPHVAYNKR